MVGVGVVVDEVEEEEVEEEEVLELRACCGRKMKGRGERKRDIHI